MFVMTNEIHFLQARLTLCLFPVCRPHSMCDASSPTRSSPLCSLMTHAAGIKWCTWASWRMCVFAGRDSPSACPLTDSCRGQLPFFFSAFSSIVLYIWFLTRISHKHTHLHTHTHTHTHTVMHTHTLKHMHTHKHTHKHINTYTVMHTLKHMHTHTQTHTHTHTHTQSC